MKVFTCGDGSGYYNEFVDEWNPAYYKCPRDIPKEIWEKYKKAREEFYELHSLIEDRFEEVYDEKTDGKMGRNRP